MNKAFAMSAATCITLSAHVFAEDTPAAMPEVVVTGQRKTYKPEKTSSLKYTAPLKDTPQTITVIPQTAIEEQGATTLRDVLRNVPGISIQAGEGGVPAGDNLSIRGFNARTDIFIDAIRDFGGYSRDPFNIQQVEVFKGPGSTFTGRGSTGGSINMVSKTPQKDPSYAGTFGLGTDDYKRTTIDLNQPIGETMAFRLNGMWNESNFPGRNVAENERWGVAPSIAFGLGTPTQATLSYLHLAQDNVPDYGIPWVPNTNTALIGYRDQPAPVDYSNFYGLKNRDYEKTNTDIATAEVKHDFSETLSLRNILRYGMTDRDSVITSPRFNANNSTAINRQLQSRDQQDSILANITDVTTKFKTGPVAHSVVTGVEYDREISENFGRSGPTAPLADLYHPNSSDPYPGPVTRNGSKTEAKSHNVGIYAFDTMKLTEKVDLTGGLRWDRFSVNVSTIGIGNIGNNEFDRVDSFISWRTGLVYKLLENGSVYFAYGTSFNPSAEGLTLAATATSTNNVNVDPESNNSYEIGSKWDFFDKKLSASAALFRTDKTNARTEDPANAADVIVLEGKQRVQGIELGFAGSPIDDLNIIGGYTFLESEVRASKNPLEIGRELANTPKQSFSIWGTYELPWNLEAGAGTQFVGSRVNSTTTPRRAPGYWVTDAMIAYHVNKNFTLRLNGYNLTDREYIDRVGGGHFIPGAARSATLTTDVKF